MSVARFIADQRTKYRVLGPAASSGLFTIMGRHRDTIDRAVRVMFAKKRGLHGPRGCTPTCVMTGGR